MNVIDGAEDVVGRYASFLVETIPDALVVVTVEGTVEFWSAGAEAMFGYAADEANGRSLYDLIVPPENADESRRTFDEYLRFGASHGEVMHHRLVRRRKDGTSLTVARSARIVEDASVNRKLFVASYRDVTSLEAQRDAQVLSARFRDLLEAIPEGVVVVNHDGRIVLVNAQTERLFAYRRGEMIGKAVEELLPERFREMHVAHRARYTAEPRLRQMGLGLDLYARRKDGSEFEVEIGLAPLHYDDQIFVMSTIRDSTERRRLEQQVRRQNRELQDTVAAQRRLEAQLQRKNVELEEQNARVQEATRLKSEFLANMSHELRTPLNAIIGFSELLVDEKAGSINSVQRDFLTDILSSAQHLLRLINDVLDLSKVEAGRIELQPVPVDVGQIVREVQEIILPMAANRHIQVTAEVRRLGGPVECDPARLKQILFNYLSNALKFTPEDGRVVVRARPDAPGHFRLEVEDTGVGIAAADLPRLFVDFQQLDLSLAKRYQGTGLGLALTKRIVEALGGSVGVRSVPGEGSTFYAVLPKRGSRTAALLDEPSAEITAPTT